MDKEFLPGQYEVAVESRVELCSFVAYGDRKRKIVCSFK